MVRLFTIIVLLSALRMKGVSVISLSNVQKALQRISKTSIPLVLLFLTFVVALSSLSLTVDAAQTASGNTPDAGTISDTRVSNGTVISGSQSPVGGSVIYSVLPSTEYYIRILVSPSSRAFFYINFFNSYPSLGSRSPFYSRDFSRDGNFAIFHFTTSPTTTFVVLSFTDFDSYDQVGNFIQRATIGKTLGLYTPLSNNSTAELSFGFTNPHELKLFLSGSGGVGNYRFTVDINYTDDNSENLLSQVSAGSYTRIVPALDHGDYLIITISDSSTSISTKIIPYIPDVNTLSSPEVDISEIPDTSISVDNNFASIIVNTFDAFPAEITALLVPVVLFCLVGWWMHK